MPRFLITLLLQVAAVGLMVLTMAEPGAAIGRDPQAAPHALLDVPYVPQPSNLCGGAAVAMVSRYWGDRDIVAQDFAPLVGARDNGILTSALVSAVRSRGWQALVGSRSRTELRAEIDRGRPVIALVEVAPRAYHYVVIVGVTEDEVVVHDPARAPCRVLPWADFNRASVSAGRWMMVMLPAPAAPPPPTSASTLASRPSPSPPSPMTIIDRPVLPPCTGLIERGVASALAGDRDAAEQELIAATIACPVDAAAWRELAGLRFAAARWRDAADLAVRAVALAPDDAYAWQLLATSRYLTGDLMGALDAWNQTGEPAIDTIDTHGALRTRQPVILERLGLRPRRILTAESFQRAARRLGDLPVVSSARMSYEPVDGGRAKVTASVDERALVPKGLMPLVLLGSTAAIRHLVRLDVAGPTGAGELWSVMGRWAPHRPRVELSLAVPAPGRLPGIASIEGFWEHQSYRPGLSIASLSTLEVRRRLGVSFADWATSWLRWRAGAAFDRFDTDDTIAVDGALDARAAGDRVSLRVSAGSWTPLDGADRYASAELDAAWRWTIDPTAANWSASTTFVVASETAPHALWSGAGPGAGTDGGRFLLLRAHRLVVDGVVVGPVFGRRVAETFLEYEHPLPGKMAGRVGVAGFVDAAKAWRRDSGLAPSRLYVDAGVGARVRAPAIPGVIRLDLGHGLRDGGTTLSLSWASAWPR